MKTEVSYLPGFESLNGKVWREPVNNFPRKITMKRIIANARSREECHIC